MDFKEKIKPQGYYDKLDDSLLDFYALVRGSYNTLISDEDKIVSRKGYELVGAAGTSTQGVKSAYTWETNTNREIGIRSIYDKFQILYNGAWKDVATGFKTLTKFRARPWWDKTEVKDKLLLVNETTAVYSWTGGYTELASWTVNTLTKKFAKQSAVANNFVFNAANKTLTQTDTDFITLGFEANQTIRIAGTTSNNGLFTIKTVTSTVITVSASDVFTNETIATNAAVVGVLGRETWAAERFATTGTKEINVGGTVFTYTGGENTPTLTGVSADPSGVASAGLFVFQPFESNTPSGGDFPVGQIIDVIEVNINQAYYGYTKSRNVFLSKQDNFLDCAYSTVRKAGEGGTIYLDNNCTGIAASKELTQISGGLSDIYNVTFEQYAEGTNYGERLKVKKLETAFGQGAINPDCFVKVKNGILYVSNEPTIDFLGSVENIVTQQSEPVSDSIKRFVNSIDLTDVNGIYAKNNVFYLCPRANAMLIYDVERGFWQPPQYISGEVLSIISGDIYIHSAITDESFKLFSGLTDNGDPINFRALTNVDTYGTRGNRKIYDEFFIEAQVNGSAKAVNANLYSGYQGAISIDNLQFGFDDDPNFLEIPALPSGLGTTPFGFAPFGGLFTDPSIDPDIGALRKIYKVSSTNILESFTHQMEFTNDEIGAYFEIVAWGVNAKLSQSNNMDIKAD